MIRRVHVESFKSLADITIELEPLTVLVGANGCGKSSVLQAMYLLAHRGTAPIHPYAEAAIPTFSQRMVYRGHGENMTLVMTHQNGATFELKAQVRPGLPPQEVVRASTHPPPPLAPAAYLQLNASEMVRTSIVEDEHPRMAPNGVGLASALAWMKGAAEDELAQITADLRQVVPQVKRIRTLRERVLQRRMEKLDIDSQPIWRPIDEAVIGDRFAIEFDDGSEVPAELLSEGTVLALGLLTKLREPERPKLILIDDIDRGLHLTAQAKLLAALRALMKLDPELQIVCTTHSPYLLDLFEPAEVRVLALDAERRTHVRPLTEHPEFAKWKFGTQTGELWAALGEDWVLGGAPG